jgi:hypothetical protein
MPVYRHIRVFTTWCFVMNMLLASTVGWGQPIVFDTVHLNPVNSFLEGNAVFETDSGYLVFGLGGDGTGTVQDPRTFQFDENGGLMNTLIFQNARLTESGSFGPVDRCASGGYVAGVNAFGNGIPMDSLYLYRYDEDGDTAWTRYLTSDTTLAPRKCIETSSGDFVIVGLHAWPKGAYMFRLTSEGDSITFVNFGDPAFFAMSVVEDAEQNLFIAGYTDTGIAEFQFRGYILKCTPDGEVLWWDAYPRNSGYNGLLLTSEGGVLAFGQKKNTEDIRGALIVKYDTDGNEEWARNDIIFADGPTRSCTFTNGFQQPDGSYIICGSLRNTALGLADKGMLYKFDEQGNTIWSRFYSHYSGLPPGYPQQFKDVKQTSDGGFILTGVTEGIAPPNSQRLWLLKLDSLGCLVPGCHTVGVEDFESNLQDALQLGPNPASEHLQVRLALPEGYRLEGAVQALLLDAQGKEVLRSTIGNTGLGLSGNMDVSGLPSGLYYLHLRDGEKWLAGGKVVLSP